MERINLEALDWRERAVILLIYAAGYTESEAAEELDGLYDDVYTRDRVHTVHRAALRKLRRSARELEAV